MFGVPPTRNRGRKQSRLLSARKTTQECAPVDSGTWRTQIRPQNVNKKQELKTGTQSDSCSTPPILNEPRLLWGREFDFSIMLYGVYPNVPVKKGERDQSSHLVGQTLRSQEHNREQESQRISQKFPIWGDRLASPFTLVNFRGELWQR